LLSYIPGAEVYVDTDGVVRVIDAADLRAPREYIRTLPAATWDGDNLSLIERDKIRPSKVIVHYQREVELLLSYTDDFGATTQSSPGRENPYMDNVIPTVDPTTRITEYNPETNRRETKDVPAGTWVNVSD
jgi:hypothetical protein